MIQIGNGKEIVYYLNIFQKMALEATLILLDNSAAAINGDYLPTRWQSQVDSASLLIQAKLQSNIQSSVGLGLMGGQQVEILCTMTSDSTKANSYLFGVKVGGQLHFTQALQIGALTLKHRANDTQKQRIVCFVASTIVEDLDTLKIFAKKLKKNGVAVDIISFGDCSEEQRNKVQTFITTVSQQDNSHRMFIEPGEVYLSEKLLGGQIFMSGGGGGNMGGMEVEDPELAEAIRMSLQESMPQPAQNNPPANQGGQAPQAEGQGQQRQQTEEELEQLAIRLSLQEAQNQQGQKKQEGGNKEDKKEDKKEQPQKKQ